jgi:cytochrome c oxidase subunit 1
MSRRIHTYREGYGFDFWNAVVSVGAFLIALSVAMFFYNIWRSKKEAAHLPAPGPDPWDSRSLEWSVPSPTPEHNFDDDPIVTELDHWWHQKYGEDEQGRVVKIAEPEEVAMVGDGSRSHLPSPSYWPIVLAFSFPLIGYGVIFNMTIAGIGGAVLLAGIIGFALEPPDDEDLPPHDHDDHSGDDDGDHAADAEPEEVTAGG